MNVCDYIMYKKSQCDHITLYNLIKSHTFTHASIRFKYIYFSSFDPLRHSHRSKTRRYRLTGAWDISRHLTSRSYHHLLSINANSVSPDIWHLRDHHSWSMFVHRFARQTQSGILYNCENFRKYNQREIQLWPTYLRDYLFLYKHACIFDTLKVILVLSKTRYVT